MAPETIAIIISIIISVISLVVASGIFPLVFFIHSRRIARGSLEIQVKNTIREANIEKQTRMVEYEAESSEETRKHIKRFKNYAYGSAIEWYLNCIDDACALAIDNKIDRTRFKKTYNLILGQIIRNKKYAKIFMKDSSFDFNFSDEKAYNNYLARGSNEAECCYHKIFSTYIDWEEKKKADECKQREMDAKKKRKENNKRKSKT